MNKSTIIMPCNESGYTDPKSTAGWSIIDFDWSNAKEIWTKQRPMRDEATLQKQVVMSTSASTLDQTVWVYRGSMWAYPWYIFHSYMIRTRLYTTRIQVRKRQKDSGRPGVS